MPVSSLMESETLTVRVQGESFFDEEINAIKGACAMLSGEGKTVFFDFGEVGIFSEEGMRQIAALAGELRGKGVRVISMARLSFSNEIERLGLGEILPCFAASEFLPTSYGPVPEVVSAATIAQMLTVAVFATMGKEGGIAIQGMRLNFIASSEVTSGGVVGTVFVGFSESGIVEAASSISGQNVRLEDEALIGWSGEILNVALGMVKRPGLQMVNSIPSAKRCPEALSAPAHACCYGPFAVWFEPKPQ